MIFSRKLVCYIFTVNLLFHILILTTTPLGIGESGGNEGAVSLGWTGEGGYVSDGVEPDLGSTNDTFEFRIMYFDVGGDDPNAGNNYIYLIFDGEANELTSVDHMYEDGSVFNVSLSGLEGGEHNYYFEARVRGDIYRLPKLEETKELTVNTDPVLVTPTVEAGARYKATLHPKVGNTTDPFLFQIVYKDADDHGPRNESGLSGVFIDRIFHHMTTPQGYGHYYDGDFTNGELYQLSVELDKGKHVYYFQFTDELGATTVTPVFEGPEVISGFPDLSIKADKNVPAIKWEVRSTDEEDWNNINVSTVVENDGGTDIQMSFGVEIEIYSIDPSTGKAELDLIQDDIVNGLNVGDSREIRMEYHPPVKGVYEVKVVVDREDDVQEIIEFAPGKGNTNNIAQARFKAGPDLRISPSDIVPNSVYNGEKTIICAKIHNDGLTDAVFHENVDVRFRFDDGERVVVNKPEIPKNSVIEAGDTYRICVEYFAKVKGNRSVVNLTIFLDPDGEMEEAIEDGDAGDNNNASTRISAVEKIYERSTGSFAPTVLFVMLILLITALAVPAPDMTEDERRSG